jgi:N-acetylneuraminic acid mutarotase
MRRAHGWFSTRSGTAASVASALIVACTGEPSPPPSSAPSAEGIRWERLAPAPTSRTEVTAASDGTRIFVIGGFVDGGGTVATVEVYDPESDLWETGVDLPVAVNHSMSASLSGEVYVFGGYLGPGLSNPTDRAFVLRSGGWVELPRMPEHRGAAGAAEVDGKLYVAGGVGPEGLADRLLVFDPSSEAWSTVPGPPTLREHLGVAGFDGRLYVVGGRTGGIGSNLGAAEAYDPATDAWSTLPDLPTPRGGIAAAATSNGFIAAAGGEAAATFDEVEAFDVRVSGWVRSPRCPPRGMAWVWRPSGRRCTSSPADLSRDWPSQTPTRQ